MSEPYPIVLLRILPLSCEEAKYVVFENLQLRMSDGPSCATFFVDEKKSVLLLALMSGTRTYHI